MRHEEDALQMAVMEYLDFLPVFAFHPKNSGFKNIQSAVRDKKLGIRAGVADIVIMWKGGKIGFIELKTEKGKLSVAQSNFQAMCQESGFNYVVCRSVLDVANTVKSWRII
jgi:hypothetical protein